MIVFTFLIESIRFLAKVSVVGLSFDTIDQDDADDVRRKGEERRAIERELETEFKMLNGSQLWLLALLASLAPSIKSPKIPPNALESSMDVDWNRAEQSREEDELRRRR